MLTTLFVSLLLCVCTAVHGSQPLQQCTPSNMKIVLRSHYNQTGHWQSQVEFVQGQEDSHGSNPWQTEVEQTSQVCDGKQSLKTVIHLQAPTVVKHDLVDCVKPPLVPSGYENISGVGVVKRSSQVKNLADAIADCAKDGAVIMSVESEAKLKYVNAFLDSPGVFTDAANDRDIWTGVRLVDGVWKTMEGVSVSDIPAFKWMSGRPVDGDCAVFAKPFQGHWDSGACAAPGAKLSYICVKRKT